MTNYRLCGAAALSLLLAAPALLAAPRAAKSKVPPLSEDEARRTAAMLDDAYQLWLQSIHDWYPTKAGQPVVAATVVRKLQEKMTAKGWPATRFVAVNGIVMNPNHLAKDAFEKEAVTALRSGKDRYEKVERGRLRVATVIPLGGGCFSCHWSDAKIGSRAALTFSIPVRGSGKGR